MSDFFTKKQRKFWCETCKIFIEYTKQIIDQHQRSKNHLRQINKELEYKTQKSKFQKMFGTGTGQNTTDNYLNPNEISIIQQHKAQQIDPLTGYLPNEKNQSFLNRKAPRDNNMNNISQFPNEQNKQNFLNKNRLNNQGLNQVLFDEIKKEKMKNELNQNTLNLINKNWTMYWDYNYNLPYYFNHFTGITQWEKPLDYNNYNNNINPILNNQNSVNNLNIPSNSINKPVEQRDEVEEENSDFDEEEFEEKENSDNEPKEEEEKEEEDNQTAGIIGKWEIVEKDQSIFGSKSANNINQSLIINEIHKKEDKPKDEEIVYDQYYIPGLINKEEFLLNEYGDNSDDESGSDNGINNSNINGLENIIGLNEVNPKPDIKQSSYIDEKEKKEKYSGKEIYKELGKE